MNLIQMDRLCDIANQDPVFTRGIRFLNTSLKCEMGDHHWLLNIEDNQIKAVEGDAEAQAPYGILLSAPEETWQQMLAPVPKPFYHTLVSAQGHGLQMISPDNLTCHQYIGALERMLVLMRTVFNEGGK